jgi:BirA family biotin operon repressor/biotin-[acetyl-CoA-carboxylase] ligase
MSDANANSLEPGSQWPSGWLVRRVAETGSTNADLLAEGALDAPHHSVLMADFQSSGKGRLDRTWVAEPGSNLLVSLLFRLHDGIARPLHQFTQLVGMAAARACNDVAGVAPSMKWPNDLLVDNQKISGILAQGAPEFVVVGIGVNVGWAPEGAVSLQQVAPTQVAQPAQLLRAMLPHISQFELLTPQQLHATYEAELKTIGQRVRIEQHGGVFIEGVATSVHADGRLLVRDDHGVEHFVDTGDVVHLRSA